MRIHIFTENPLTNQTTNQPPTSAYLPTPRLWRTPCPAVKAILGLDFDYHHTTIITLLEFGFTYLSACRPSSASRSCSPPSSGPRESE
jgi:hypothetical protein